MVKKDRLPGQTGPVTAIMTVVTATPVATAAAATSSSSSSAAGEASMGGVQYRTRTISTFGYHGRDRYRTSIVEYLIISVTTERRRCGHSRWAFWPARSVLPSFEVRNQSTTTVPIPVRYSEDTRTSATSSVSSLLHPFSFLSRRDDRSRQGSTNTVVGWYTYRTSTRTCTVR